VSRTRILAETDGDRRTELLNILVSGYDESDGRVARLLKRAGYLEQRLSFCVALVRSVDPLEMENPARAQRIVESIAEAVATTPIRTLLGTRDGVVTAVFSDTRRLSGWTAPQAQLAARIHSALLVLGPAVLTGISADQPSTAFIPAALREAAVALDFASVSERVVRFSELPIRRLLLHRAAGALKSALPPWITELASADVKAQGALIQTLRALADADLNVQQAARVLEVHPNTVYARLQRIDELTGLSSRRFHDLTELLLAADCRQATP
jgi:sugar diacid utilization regulator